MTRRLVTSLSAIALLACLTIALPSVASAQFSGMRVHVPFDFQLNGEAMPAGQYYFESPINGGMIYLTSVSSGARRAVIAMPVGSHSNPKGPQVVFERLGDRYRLSQVWANAGSVGCGLRLTKAEREYARQFGKGTLIALSVSR